jgi:hypothetical protein
MGKTTFSIDQRSHRRFDYERDICASPSHASWITSGQDRDAGEQQPKSEKTQDQLRGDLNTTKRPFFCTEPTSAQPNNRNVFLFANQPVVPELRLNARVECGSSG